MARTRRPRRRALPVPGPASALPQRTFPQAYLNYLSQCARNLYAAAEEVQGSDDESIDDGKLKTTSINDNIITSDNLEAANIHDGNPKETKTHDGKPEETKTHDGKPEEANTHGSELKEAETHDEKSKEASIKPDEVLKGKGVFIQTGSPQEKPTLTAHASETLENIYRQDIVLDAGPFNHIRMELRQPQTIPSVQATSTSTPSDDDDCELRDADPALLYTQAASTSRAASVGCITSGLIPSASDITSAAMQRCPSAPTARNAISVGQRGNFPASLSEDAGRSDNRRILPVLGSLQTPTQLKADTPSFRPKGPTSAAPLSYADVVKKGDQLPQQAASSSKSTTNKDVTRNKGELGITASYHLMCKETALAGWGDSPFLPQCAYDYAVQKRAAVSVQMKQKMKRVQVLEAQMGKPKATLKLNSDDGLSTMLSQMTCFNNLTAVSTGNTTDWPTTQELQMSSGRLPPPQGNQTQSGEKALPAIVFYEGIETCRWDWLTPVEASMLRDERPESISEETVNHYIRDLLKEIDDDDLWTD